ncbi:hypothetical protein N7508_001731 [Penicillium antarcticum]|uniref:uncharacterized protein n=1 Tax=Penicillium antarcticum TaxID=416450 RepID=UPI0023878737|nr:uncharacterized protein N7508_001731 [Penicillium antarcticum]KAJ5317223.1 hypothetical protein N7508_001731 [Penicillium antarcticum]
MAESAMRTRGAVSGAEGFWGRSLDRTLSFEDQSRRGRVDSRELGYIMDAREPHRRNDFHESSRRNLVLESDRRLNGGESGRGHGQESGRGLSRDHGSSYYRDYERKHSRRDYDANERENDRERYRRREYYPNNYREEDYDSYCGRGASGNDRRRCFICNIPGHLASRHNAWALTNHRHVAGSIGMTEPVLLSINSRAQMSILPQRAPPQQELLPVNLSALATAWQQYLAPGIDEVENALATLQSVNVAMGAMAPHAEISAMVSSWDKLIAPGRVRMERSLAAMGFSPEGDRQEGRVSSSTTTARGNQEEPKYAANESVTMMTDAVEVGATNIDTGYDFDIY